MRLGVFSLLMLVIAACDGKKSSIPPMPRDVVDLGTVVTEDITERHVGNRWRESFGFMRPNQFDVISWRMGPIKGQNSYYTLFNHGSPHVDAPIHFGFEGGIDSYPIESFLGPLRVFDVRGFDAGRNVPVEIFAEQGLSEGDIVLIYTGYTPPSSDDELPESITLTRAAAEYLASIPILAFGTDSASVGTYDPRPVEAETEVARLAPIHDAFLSVGIPIYEQLFNVDQLLGVENAYFVGVPVNIQGGDGMLVRPVVIVY